MRILSILSLAGVTMATHTKMMASEEISSVLKVGNELEIILGSSTHHSFFFFKTKVHNHVVFL